MTKEEATPVDEDAVIVATEPHSIYTAEHATASLDRAARLVLALTAIGIPVAWFLRGWQSGVLLLVGAAISASGLWEWKRLMAALMARMDAQERVQTASGTGEVQTPSVTFAVAGFMLRLLLIVAALYGSLKHLHGSVLALAAGLALGVVSLTVEGIRLLRDGTI